MNKMLTPDQIHNYNRDGYLLMRGFFTQAEIDKLYSTALEDDAMKKNALDLNDQTGKKTRLSLCV